MSPIPCTHRRYRNTIWGFSRTRFIEEVRNSPPRGDRWEWNKRGRSSALQRHSLTKRLEGSFHYKAKTNECTAACRQAGAMASLLTTVKISTYILLLPNFATFLFYFLLIALIRQEYLYRDLGVLGLNPGIRAKICVKFTNTN